MGAARRALLLLAIAGALTGAPARAPAAAPQPAWLSKLDPSLASWAANGSEPRTLWVEFSDKAPGGPADLAEALARAERDLTQRARSRRLRAGVRPLVDDRDVPVPSVYLEALAERGNPPLTVSRWLNRAAVRALPVDLEPLARLPFVARFLPVRSARTRPDPERPAILLPAPPGPAGGLERTRPARLLGSASDPGIATGQLAQVGLTRLHESGYTGQGALIAIFDQGFNFHWKHDALRDIAFPPGYRRDFVERDTVVSDTTDLLNFRHGTWILGLLGADLPGVYQGSAYGATFALARTEAGASETPVEMLYWAEAAEWADSLGADLIASSVGYNDFDPVGPSPGDLAASDLDGHTSEISRAAEIAASKGILPVNSVGNGGFGPLPRLAAPADVNGDSLIAVGAVDSLGRVASFSSRGPTADGRVKPDLVARGVLTWLVHAGGLPSAYEQGDGTSFSAPLVAGLAACVMQARPALAPVEVIRALRETASAMCVPDQDRGWGLPDGPAAIVWTPGPAGVTGSPGGYLELRNAGALPVRRDRGPLRLRFGLGPRLASSPDARLRVYDAQGRVVRRLFYGSLTCGRWQAVDWDGSDGEGRRVRPGVYLVHFDAEGRTRTLRVVLLD